MNAWECLAGTGVVVIEVNRLVCFPFNLIIWEYVACVRWIFVLLLFSVAALTPVFVWKTCNLKICMCTEEVIVDK